MSNDEVPSAEEQKFLLGKYLSITKPTETGEQWAVIEKEWYDNWKVYVGLTMSSPSKNEPKKPGKINNEKLLVQGGGSGGFTKMIRFLTPEDYVLVRKEAFDLLQKWYGGGPIILRNSIYHTHMDVEVYPLSITLFPPKHDEEGNTKEVSIVESKRIVCSKHITFETFYKKVAGMFELQPTFDLWMSLNGRAYRILPLSSLRNHRLSSLFLRVYDQEVQVVIPSKTPKLENIEFVLPNNEKRPISSCYRNKEKELRGGEPHSLVPTCCGLKNLGNTCYLSASLQCLSRLGIVHPYFRDASQWRDQINQLNPLGMGGKMVKSFSRTVTQMWAEKWGYLYPREVKYVIQRFNPVYEGARQQDVSEFTQDLLRALHEDLKQTVTQFTEEQEESEGEETDQEKKTPTSPADLKMNYTTASHVDKSWAHFFKMEGDSIINRTFYGQFRNEKRCQQCGMVKPTFQPFLILHLPLPDTGPSLSIRFLYHLNRKTPEKVEIMGTDEIMVGELKRHLQDLTGVLDEHMVVMRAEKVLMDHEMIDESPHLQKEKEEDHEMVYVYEMTNYKKMMKKNQSNISEKVYSPSSPTTDLSGEILLHVTARGKDSNGKNVPIDPFYIRAEKGVTKHSDLFNQCVKHIWHYVRSKTKQGMEPKASVWFENYGLEMLKKTTLFQLFHNNKNLMTQILYGEDYFDLREDTAREGLLLDIPTESLWESYDLSRFSYYADRTKYVGDSLTMEKLCKKLKEEQTVHYNCLNCKHQRSTEKIDLWRLPKVLLVCFSRFKNDERTGKAIKIQSFIDFPLKNFKLGELSGNVMNRNKTYNLRGVCEHMGSALNCGHYTSNVKFLDKDNKEVWMRVNNERTEMIEEIDAKSSNAYLLFYELVEDNE